MSQVSSDNDDLPFINELKARPASRESSVGSSVGSNKGLDSIRETKSVVREKQNPSIPENHLKKNRKIIALRQHTKRAQQL